MKALALGERQGDERLQRRARRAVFRNEVTSRAPAAMPSPQLSDLNRLSRFNPETGPMVGAIKVTLLALALASALFVLMPGLDLAVSRLFYTPGQGFVFGNSKPIVAIRNSGIGLTWIICAGLIALALWWRARPTAVGRWPSLRPWADWLFVTAAMAIGPGALVNLVIKPIWGRARPRQVLEFGGQMNFTPAWVVTNQCSWGCSFVSGEAAASAYLFVFAFIVPPRWRPLAFWSALAVTLIISFVRIAAGGHYLSDVVIASLLIILLLLILHAQIYHHTWLGPLKRWSPVR
jgi:lipid A 4'-phosphatase